MTFSPLRTKKRVGHLRLGDQSVRGFPVGVERMPVRDLRHAFCERSAQAVGERRAGGRRPAAMIRPTSTKSSTPSPRVASAGEPILRPDETAGNAGRTGPRCG